MSAPKNHRWTVSVEHEEVESWWEGGSRRSIKRPHDVYTKACTGERLDHQPSGFWDPVTCRRCLYSRSTDEALLEEESARRLEHLRGELRPLQARAKELERAIQAEMRDLEKLRVRRTHKEFGWGDDL